MITNIRLIMLFFFIALFKDYPIWSVVLLTVMILLDMIDGSLARYQKVASDRGKFLDFSVDMLSYAFIAMTFLFVGIDAIHIVLNIIFVEFAHLFAVVKKREFTKSDWIIHPSANAAYLSLPVLFSFYLYNVFAIDIAVPIFYISTGLSIVCFVYYYIALQCRWKRTRQ